MNHKPNNCIPLPIDRANPMHNFRNEVETKWTKIILVCLKVPSLFSLLGLQHHFFPTVESQYSIHCSPHSFPEKPLCVLVIWFHKFTKLLFRIPYNSRCNSIQNLKHRQNPENTYPKCTVILELDFLGVHSLDVSLGSPSGVNNNNLR